METKKQTTDTIITLFVKVAAKSSSAGKARQALLDDVHGAWSEPGNYKMELYQAKGHPDNFYLFERWQNRDVLEQHFKQPYTSAAFDLQNGDLVSPIEMNYLTDLWPRETDRRKIAHEPLTTLIVPFEAKPGNAEAFIGFFEKFVQLVRTEPGNVDFNFHSINGRADHFVLYERWRTQDHLDLHNQRPTTAAFMNSVQPLLTAPIMESVLFASDISTSTIHPIQFL